MAGLTICGPAASRVVRDSRPFGQFARRARSEPGWRYVELDASHSPNVTAPEALAGLLDDIAAGPPAAHQPERRSGARPGLPASE